MSRHLKSVDIVSGGFPCQDISTAGGRAGITGARSGLWGEYFRIIRALRPRFVVVENVAALLHRGVERVLGDLVECGYDAEWETISACAFGFSHLRRRVFIVAYPKGAGLAERRNESGKSGSANPAAQEPGSNRFARPSSTETMATWDDWAPESVLLGKTHGIPGRVDRMRVIGNAVVPQIAEWIGRRIVEACR